MTNREIDALIAERVFGWKHTLVCNFPAQMEPPDGDGCVRSVPHYSESISDAWMVVEKMSADHVFQFNNNISDWTVMVSPRTRVSFSYLLGWSGVHKNPSTAICLATLRAIGIDQYTDIIQEKQ